MKTAMVQETTINERLKLVVQQLGVSQVEFSKITDIAKGNLSQILKGKRSCGEAIIRKVASKYPQVNTYWLRTGNGEMFGANRPLGEAFEKKMADVNLSKSLIDGYEKENLPPGLVSKAQADEIQRYIASQIKSSNELSESLLNMSKGVDEKLTEKLNDVMNKCNTILDSSNRLLQTINTLAENLVEMSKSKPQSHKDSVE